MRWGSSLQMIRHIIQPKLYSITPFIAIEIARLWSFLYRPDSSMDGSCRHPPLPLNSPASAGNRALRPMTRMPSLPVFFAERERSLLSVWAAAALGGISSQSSADGRLAHEGWHPDAVPSAAVRAAGHWRRRKGDAAVGCIPSRADERRDSGGLQHPAVRGGHAGSGGI